MEYKEQIERAFNSACVIRNQSNKKKVYDNLIKGKMKLIKTYFIILNDSGINNIAVNYVD
jgi:hypothetical protein